MSRTISLRSAVALLGALVLAGAAAVYLVAPGEDEGAGAAAASTDLSAYLTSMEAVQTEYVTLRDQAVMPLERLEADSAPAEVDRVADLMINSGQGYLALADRAQGIAVPADLRDAHDGYVESLGLLSSWVGQMGTTLKNEGPVGLLNLTNSAGEELNRDSDRAIALRVAWRATTGTVLRAAGLNVPAWVQTVGTQPN